MVIWQTQTSHLFQALDYVNEHDVRMTLNYDRGRLTQWHPFHVVFATDVYDDMDETMVRVPNFPSLSGDIACDEEAKLWLVGLVRDHVEFLPLHSRTILDKRYYFLFPRTVLDCLDNEKSEFVRLRSGYIRGIKKHVFKSNCIGDTPIFRLPIAGSPSSRPYVTDEFKRLIEDNNLTGLKFRKVWEG